MKNLLDKKCCACYTAVYHAVIVIERSSVRPSVCPVNRQQQRRPEGLLLTSGASLQHYRSICGSRKFWSDCKEVQRTCLLEQEAQLSPRDRAMRRVSWNLANCHATVQKLLERQVLNESKLWSWRVTVGRCVINMCTQPWRDRVASSSVILYRCHKQTDDGPVVDITCIPTTCCGEMF